MGQPIVRSCDNWSRDSVIQLNTPSVTAMNTLFYIQEIGYFKVQPPYFVEREGLASFLLIYTLAGKGVVETGAGREELMAGTAVLIDCEQPHRYAATEAGTWEFLWVHFYGSSSRGYFQEYARGASQAVTVRNEGLFEGLFRELLALQPQSTVAAELQISQKIVTMMTEILLSCDRITAEPGICPAYISEMIREMEASFEEDLSLEHMAEKYNISKFHLSRQFKVWTGTTYIDYLLRIRIRHAKDFLMFTDMPVGMIAFCCGFNDESYFIRVFKARERGMTPMAFRKIWAEPVRGRRCGTGL